jgi:hypothetical protein
MGSMITLVRSSVSYTCWVKKFELVEFRVAGERVFVKKMMYESYSGSV